MTKIERIKVMELSSKIKKKFNTEFLEKDATETLSFAMMLAFVGGIMDIYTYIVRGNVFATGQTGNLVLVAMHLSEGDYIRMLYPLVPILFFWIGNFAAWHILYSHANGNKLLWKRVILLLEIIILFIAGWIPADYPDILANICVSISASLQFCAFRKFGNTQNYASIFCTGNMRSCGDHYYQGIIRKDRQSLKKAFHYSYILLSFFVGAVMSGFASKIFQEKAIWSVVIILTGALVLSLVFQSKRWKLRFCNT